MITMLSIFSGFFFCYSGKQRLLLVLTDLSSESMWKEVCGQWVWTTESKPSVKNKNIPLTTLTGYFSEIFSQKIDEYLSECFFLGYLCHTVTKLFNDMRVSKFLFFLVNYSFKEIWGKCLSVFLLTFVYMNQHILSKLSFLRWKHYVDVLVVS